MTYLAVKVRWHVLSLETTQGWGGPRTTQEVGCHLQLQVAQTWLSVTGHVVPDKLRLDYGG